MLEIEFAGTLPLGELYRAHVTSENDAWELLARTETGEFDNKILIPIFDGWPTTQFTFWVDREHEVLTAPIMEGLLSFQMGLYRSFVFLQGGSTNLRRLNEELRKAAEIKFQVVPGCTKFEVDLTEIAKDFTSKALKKMTGKQITVIVIAMILALASSSVWKVWMDEKKAEALETSHSEEVNNILAAQKFADEADNKRMELLISALSGVKDGHQLVDASNESREGLLKTAAHVSSTEMFGIDLPPSVARPMHRKTRSLPDEGTITGEFKILRVDSDRPDGFRARLLDESTGEEFFASVRDVMLAPNDRNIISTAEWNKRPVFAQVRIKRQRGIITSGEIIKVSEQPYITN